MSAAGNVKTVQDIYSAFSREDIAFILDALAENVVWHEPPAGEPPFKGTYQGRSGVGKFFQGLAEAVEMQAFEPREFFTHQSDVVVVLGSYRFRAKKTGKICETSWAMVWASATAGSSSVWFTRIPPQSPKRSAVPR